jgi:hypothetical protein
VNLEELLQDYAAAEQRKAASLEELNTHFAAAIALLEQLIDVLTADGDKKEHEARFGW